MDITDQFSCPVCLSIPPGNIFQCCNGHTVCRACYKNRSRCQECNVRYGKVDIRNIALEIILNARKFNCPNNALGCKERIFRNEIPEHLHRCNFAVATVPLCKLLGYNCHFKSCSTNIPEMVHHFAHFHRSLPYDMGNAVQINLDNFASTDFSRSGGWTPVIFVEKKNSDMQGSCMIIPKTNGEDETLSLIPLMLGGRRQEFNAFSGNFALGNKNESKSPMEWCTSGVTLYECEQAIKKPMFRMPSKLLKKDYVNVYNGCLEILAVIKSKQEGGFTMAGVTATQTIHVGNQTSHQKVNPRSKLSRPASDDDEVVSACTFQDSMNRVLAEELERQERAYNLARKQRQNKKYSKHFFH